MIDSTFLEQLRKMNFLARRKVSGIYMGSRKSIRQGKGIEIADHRDYYPGDDFRSIDWRLYGRTEKLYIRRFEEEKDLTLHILIDSSASMNFSTTKMNKFDYSGSIGVGFAYIAMCNHEKFTSALYSDHITGLIQTKKGKRNFFRMIEILNNAKLRGKTNLDSCMEQYTKIIKSKSFIIVISDFIEPIESLRNGIYRIAKHSKEAILIQVLDPGEIYLRWSDDIKFEDMETSRFEIAYLSPEFKNRYRNRLNEHIFEIQKICNDTGIEFFSITTEKPVFNSFMNILRDETKISRHMNKNVQKI